MSELLYRLRFYAGVAMALVSCTGMWFLGGCTDTQATQATAVTYEPSKIPMVDVSQLQHGQAQSLKPSDGNK